MLWWQFVIMERYLARTYAASGRTGMTYGLSLGSHGQLRLVFLSDAACHAAQGRGIAPKLRLFARACMLDNLSADHPCNEFSVEQDHAPFFATPASILLYLDPG